MPIDVNREIQIIARTGKKDYGVKRTIKAAKLGKAKLIILANNCMEDAKQQIEYYAKLANIPILTYSGTGYELGSLCGRGHVIAAISVMDPGDSKVLKNLK